MRRFAGPMKKPRYRQVPANPDLATAKAGSRRSPADRLRRKGTDRVFSVFRRQAIRDPARAVANCGVPLQSAVAAGISAIGENHGGAGERCARLLQDAVAAEPTRPVNELAEQIVAEARAEKRRLPGFGHRLHDPDPRAVRLLTLAAQWNLSGQHTALALAIVSTLREATGRSLPLNVDGAIGALISDLGMHWRYGKAMFILGRAAGFVAHVQEELETGKPFQFASKLDVLYVGAAERPLPD